MTEIRVALGGETKMQIGFERVKVGKEGQIEMRGN